MKQIIILFIFVVGCNVNNPTQIDTGLWNLKSNNQYQLNEPNSLLDVYLNVENCNEIIITSDSTGLRITELHINSDTKIDLENAEYSPVKAEYKIPVNFCKGVNNELLKMQYVLFSDGMPFSKYPNSDRIENVEMDITGLTEIIKRSNRC